MSGNDVKPDSFESIVESIAQLLAEGMLLVGRSCIVVRVKDELYTVTVNGPVVLRKKDPNMSLEDYFKEGWVHD